MLNDRKYGQNHYCHLPPIFFHNDKKKGRKGVRTKGGKGRKESLSHVWKCLTIRNKRSYFLTRLIHSSPPKVVLFTRKTVPSPSIPPVNTFIIKWNSIINPRKETFFDQISGP